MDPAMIDAHLENINRRLTNLEQILPTLATRADLTVLATKEELTALATRADLTALAAREELRLAVEPLATKEELRLAIEPLATKGELREGFERVRQHLTILIEHQDDKIQLLIDHVQSLRPSRSGE
jgi:hypothetical protein